MYKTICSCAVKFPLFNLIGDFIKENHLESPSVSWVVDVAMHTPHFIALLVFNDLSSVVYGIVYLVFVCKLLCCDSFCLFILFVDPGILSWFIIRKYYCVI